MSYIPTAGSGSAHTATTLPEAVDRQASLRPDDDAVVAADGRLTWSQLAGRVSTLASALVAEGVRPGDRIGVLLPNGLRWIVSALAVQHAGATVVPINTWYRSAEIAHVLDEAAITLVVTEESVFGRDTLTELAAAGLPERVPGARTGALVWNAGEALPATVRPAGPAHPVPGARQDGLAYVLFTSGSTSRPKPVPLRHDLLLRNAAEIGARQRLVAGDRLWISAPFFFGYGCSNALPVAFCHGVTLCVEERPAGDTSLEFIDRERCTVYYGFGPTTRNLLAAPGFGRHDISSLRTGTTGFTHEDRRLVLEELGIAGICSVYGLTEAYGHSTMTEPDDPPEIVLGTAGRVLDTQEIRITDDDGRILPVGETGEIELRGCVIDGYLGDPVLGHDTFRDDGWLRTGDLGSLDHEQRLRVVGRKKEMVKVKGINIAPIEVEELLCSHPGVDQAFVVGIEDAQGSEQMVAAVVPRGVPSADLPQQLDAHVRKRAAGYKVPSRIEIIALADVPLTDTGKFSKRLLRDRLAGGAR
ncbi:MULTISPECIES: class I adenylate-forming enzyme family protein [Pseudonocardia]|uniref:Long-chain-fatty-acid--CoA ligase n=2 Tax=Pseudonocardia TaxID=1847 RepID=A0A1Y2MP55_PSEAH|nr:MULTISPECIES: AMP-binding protein [Pseudonocardia]OSY36962.1 Long-chain-fatty-acid--CoA ligase [Pseudonocardia autotrophica]TDN75645.1 fatty-acyl-CoA synthase [Pseudonocardia autotrophica]BBF99617.1 3-[(3aS,4S,7aS)-7a-methyl-1,5-dioxo-octahydro-1H- inden-4-yl]propanoyl:CoA ligase [Pseudonocardia autotrophica]GEC27679.1 3-[(3aS,4S,7aS)-7a-methyl-1,5-dioxo-octahydro-1H- inden-4-yl]propanoyl:CoA ligase [Pseudonocardia saturnea]